MHPPAIEVSGLSKRYVIEHEARHDSLRDTLHHTARRAWRRLRWGTGFEREEFWALRDVSFDVRPGEVMGIIGRNGAGKSTLLKVLSRITEPTAGRVTLRGRVASLLEVGTGFHPELSGRENIYLNGAILGMSRAEIRRKFDEIVAFAEVDRFLDTPVKRYSSGMYVRLAFAVAAHLEPEILIVDEVLAVGDAAFQKKCLGKMREVSRGQGRTVLFVSHQIGAVRDLCSRAVLLRAGQVARLGEVGPVVNDYLGLGREAENGFSDRLRQPGSGSARIDDAALLADETPTHSVLSGEPLRLLVRVTVHEPAPFALECLLRGPDGLPVAFHPGGLLAGADHRLVPGRYELRVDLAPPGLAAGPYSLDLMLAESGRRFHDYLEHALTFRVEPRRQPASGWAFSQDTAQGCLLLPATHRPPAPLA